ncbi:hypothetical protein HYY69_03875 [Candidatus Woesearchaeota archaeon]|nr:hypothetical protein [Candidatus Woesearchaeota archaeon]
MAKLVSFRFNPHELEHIGNISTIKRIDRTRATRELIEYGWKYYVLKQYKEGKWSLQKTAKELHISLSELLDLLAEIGVKSPILYEDYLEGLKNIE